MSDPYYLHRLVWRNDVESLKTALEQDKGDLEVRKEVPKYQLPGREVFWVIIVRNFVFWFCCGIVLQVF